VDIFVAVEEIASLIGARKDGVWGLLGCVDIFVDVEGIASLIGARKDGGGLVYNRRK
jgi:hypothetical protein